MDQDPLIFVGLTEVEAKLYRKLSELGPSTGYRLAKATDTYKANAYEALKSLAKTGVVSTTTVDGKQLYQAESPHKLVSRIKQQEAALNQEIARLELAQQMQRGENTVAVLHGIDAIFDEFAAMLSLRSTILTWGVPKETRGIIGPRIEEFHKKRIQERVEMRHIYNYEATSRVKHLLKLPFTPCRRLRSLYDSKVTTFVCGDRVYLITVLSQPIKIVRIIDSDMADAYRNYFEILWAESEPFDDA